MNKNRKKLIDVMNANNINCIDVARALGVKPNTPRVWRSVNGQSIPDKSLELLIYKLEKRNAKNL